TRTKLWGVRFAHEPKWTRHLLKVSVERVRELSDNEADKLDSVMRADYAPFFAFARASGLRLAECLLRWSEVEGVEIERIFPPNFRAEKSEPKRPPISRGQIVKFGKGGKRVTVPITSEIADLLRPLRGHHPEYVFTYVCERGEHGREKGKRYPITY